MSKRQAPPHPRRLPHMLTLSLLLGLLLGGLPAPARGQVRPGPASPQPATLTSQIFLPALRAAGGPSSADLIDEALRRGAISAEQALTYRVFAGFRDPRLPASLRGDDSRGGEEGLLAELQARFPGLSPAAKATLRPFLLPPYHAGSWWDLRRRPAPQAGPGLDEYRPCDFLNQDRPLFEEWEYLDSPSGRVRIWWQADHPADAVKARQIYTVVDTIWGHLANLFGRQPPDDNGDLLPCRGGSDAFDISIVDIYNAGEVWRYDVEDPGPGPWPTVMLMSRNVLTPEQYPTLTPAQTQRAALIHELAHVFQLAYNTKGFDDMDDDHKWWREATATWAIHYVEERVSGWETNFEHDYASELLKEPEVPLDTLLYHAYGSYLFPLDLDLRKADVPTLVRRSFERSEQIENSLVNINELLDGGWLKQWPLFALRSLNRPPADHFHKGDGLARQAKLKGDTSARLQGGWDYSYEMDGNVKHLASHAYRFTFDDPAVRSVALVNPYYGGAWPTASMQILYRANGVWKEEDLTALNGKPWCRDFKAERVEELYVVIGNSEWRDRNHVLKPAEPPRLNVTNIACRGWEVQARVESVTLGFGEERMTETTVSTARLERQRAESNTGGIGQLEVYKVVSGSVSWEHKGTFAGCAGAQKGGYQLGPQGYALAIHQYALDAKARGYARTRHYHGYGGDEKWKGAQIPYTCPNGRVDMNSTLHGFWFLTGLPEQNPGLIIGPAGTQITGTYRFGGEEQWHDFSWTMTALPPE